MFPSRGISTLIAVLVVAGAEIVIKETGYMRPSVGAILVIIAVLVIVVI